MSTVVIDAATRDKFLAAPGDVVEVRDEAGKLVGRLIVEGPPTPPPGYEIVGEWPSDEEIDRRLREEPSYTPEQVMDRLRRISDAS